MVMKPFFTMTRREAHDHLANLSPPEQERIRQILQHSNSMYDFSGKHIPHEFEKENLLEVISGRDAYIVDSNSDWKKECKRHLDKAFIISPALARENPNIQDLILEVSRSKLGNLFSVGIDANLNCILIDRIDEHFHHVFDVAKIKEASKGNGEIFARQKVTHLRNVEEEKRRFRFNIEIATLDLGHICFPFYTSGKAYDLPTPKALKSTIDRQKIAIKKRLSECKYNVNKSKRAVEFCYLTLLLEDTKYKETRQKFDKPNYEHVFGDMYILQSAVYLGAKILTNDNGLIQMAGYAEIKCFNAVPEAKHPPKTS